MPSGLVAFLALIFFSSFNTWSAVMEKKGVVVEDEGWGVDGCGRELRWCEGGSGAVQNIPVCGLKAVLQRLSGLHRALFHIPDGGGLFLHHRYVNGLQSHQVVI